ncbi:NAD(P)-dependent dehydrogenase (short-subunit alcohol dehydrogenase family) [Bradyrhizobium sp. LB8.2]|uniref:SDR family NAD(P)-dependent oxidoreductase n=1 Tax=unclassified Bradyrhizobium TaxID=2631580 RepID=UPI0033910C47
MTGQQTILVTGGASGIGLAVVEAVLAEGWWAIVADMDQRSLDRCRDALGGADEKGRFEQMPESGDCFLCETQLHTKRECLGLAGRSS